MEQLTRKRKIKSIVLQKEWTGRGSTKVSDKSERGDNQKVGHRLDYAGKAQSDRSKGKKRTRARRRSNLGRKRKG